MIEQKLLVRNYYLFYILPVSNWIYLFRDVPFTSPLKCSELSNSPLIENNKLPLLCILASSNLTPNHLPTEPAHVERKTVLV